jgi:hypothetical protein
MGAWSHEPFGNDTANDWAYELEGKRDFSLVAKALRAVLDAGDETLDADIATEAVAAAEVLAKALGRGSQSDAYTKKVDAWLASLAVRPAPELLADARAALGRILGEDSELRELWEDSDDAEAWERSVRTLQAALSA